MKTNMKKYIITQDEVQDIINFVGNSIYQGKTVDTWKFQSLVSNLPEHKEEVADKDKAKCQ